MTRPHALLLDRRGVLALDGADATAFLQGLVSNDVTRATEACAIHTALLTPQGRYLHDFFVIRFGDGFRLDGEAARLDDLARRLTRYRLRARVEIVDAGAAFAVYALFGAGAVAAAGLTPTPGAARVQDGGVLFTDPRAIGLGARAILPRETAAATLTALGFAVGEAPDLAPGEAPGLAEAPHLAEDYERLRLSLGVPDGSRDLPVEKALLMENGFETFNGLDWNKGCYVGQEITARMKHRALIKRRLVPVAVDGPLPPPDTPITADGRAMGTLRSGLDGLALALLRVEAIEAEDGPDLIAGEARLRVLKNDKGL